MAKKAPPKTTKKVPVNNHIYSLEIKNFKSIKHIKIEPKKINLFIGRPNVGKSNILEGIALLGSGYSQISHDAQYLSDLIRFKEFDELFFERILTNRITIDSNIGFSSIGYHFNVNCFDLLISPTNKIMNALIGWEHESIHFMEKKFTSFISENKGFEPIITPYWTSISSSGHVSLGASIPTHTSSPVKKFDFVKTEDFENRYPYYLLPANGKNLYTILQRNKSLRKEVCDLFKPYKLEFILKSHRPNFELHKKSEGISTSYPYTSIADTLQRYIFHLAAIKSNQNSVLLFEEPESHSHPAYVRRIAEMIINDNNNNQYFIATHSPYILNIIAEGIDSKHLNIYKLSYEKSQTKVDLVSEKEMRGLLNYGTDILFKV